MAVHSFNQRALVQRRRFTNTAEEKALILATAYIGWAMANHRSPPDKRRSWCDASREQLTDMIRQAAFGLGYAV